mmetsp:Transcript_14607/g.14234  ORF Transcript_14607/g.14234 Transcript_14607/m.14234 type:complete len:130 (+) Transcript_14607:606-995(+)
MSICPILSPVGICGVRLELLLRLLVVLGVVVFLVLCVHGGPEEDGLSVGCHSRVLNIDIDLIIVFHRHYRGHLVRAKGLLLLVCLGVPALIKHIALESEIIDLVLSTLIFNIDLRAGWSVFPHSTWCLA